MSLVPLNPCYGSICIVTIVGGFNYDMSVNMSSLLWYVNNSQVSTSGVGVNMAHRDVVSREVAANYYKWRFLVVYFLKAKIHMAPGFLDQKKPCH